MNVRMPQAYNYIIVGAGSAGCLVANRLSADPTVRVLLLEAGGSDNHPWVHLPYGYLHCIGNPRTDWMFMTEPEQGLAGRAIRYPRGKILGGSSSINGMIYMRGQAQDYDGWSASGNAGWSRAEVLQYFIRHESHYRLDDGSADELHGAAGELRVERQRVRWDVLDSFRDALCESGIPAVSDFNGGDNDGCGYFEVNQRRGIRQNARKAFLKPVLHRRNLTLVTKAHAAALRRNSQTGRIDEVEYLANSATHNVRATDEVILCAGAIGTPHLLQLSGFGPASMLVGAGIPVRADIAGIGMNLQDHLQLRMIYRIAGAKTLNDMAHSWLGKLSIATRYILWRSGPLSMSPSQLGAFTRSDPSRTRANIEWHIQPLSLDQFGDPLHRFPAVTASPCNLQPTSRGSIRVRSPDPLVPPAISPNYLSTDEDLLVAVQSMRLTRRIMAAPPLARYKPQELLPGAAVQTDLELMESARRIATTIFHPVGTCRMGPESDPMAVVDHRLRCRALPGLRIADASVMPLIVSGNTNAPTLMIAEKGASMVLEDRKH
jgi:choline dehydrogenase